VKEAGRLLLASINKWHCSAFLQAQVLLPLRAMWARTTTSTPPS
jgi:hypothetical protein